MDEWEPTRLNPIGRRKVDRMHWRGWSVAAIVTLVSAVFGCFTWLAASSGWGPLPSPRSMVQQVRHEDSTSIDSVARVLATHIEDERTALERIEKNSLAGAAAACALLSRRELLILEQMGSSCPSITATSVGAAPPRGH